MGGSCERVNPITRGTHTQAPQRHWRGISNQSLHKRSIFYTFKFSCGWDPKSMSHWANLGVHTHTHSHRHMQDLGASGTSAARWVEHHPAGVCPSPPCTISIYFHLPNWAPLWVGSLTQQVFRCVLTSWPWITCWTLVSSSIKMEESITHLQIPRVDWDVWTHPALSEHSISKSLLPSSLPFRGRPFPSFWSPFHNLPLCFSLLLACLSSDIPAWPWAPRRLCCPYWLRIMSIR